MKKNKDFLPIDFRIESPKRRYTIESVLGSGGFGITYKAHAEILVDNIPVQSHFAIKEHFMSDVCEREFGSGTVLYSNPVKERVESSRRDFLTEARRLNALSGKNANIVRVNEVFEANNTAYYVMEYLDGGDLRSLVKEKGAMAESQALAAILPIVRAVQFLHDNRLLHLDIKPDNVVMRTNRQTGELVPVLIDFGIAKHFDKSGKPTSTSLNAKGVSDGYAPIEQYDSIARFDAKLDVYALGATLLFLLTGKDPEKAFDFDSSRVASLLPEMVSGYTVAAITGAMRKLKENRIPSAIDLAKAMAKPHTLMPGQVVRSPYAAYRITEILGEGAFYVEYKVTGSSVDALIDTLPSGDSSQNPTRTLNSCTMLEYFVPSAFTRETDGQVAGMADPDSLEEFGLKVSSVKKLMSVDDDECFVVNEDGSVYIDEFHQNKTWYLVCGQKRRVDWIRMVWQNLKRYSRLIASVAAGLIILGMITGSIVWYINQPKNRVKDTQSPLSQQAELMQEAYPSASSGQDQDQVSMGVGDVEIYSEVAEAHEPGIMTVTEGAFEITSFPDARIWLDGRDTRQKTPYTFKDLGEGNYRVVLKQDGYEDMQLTVSVKAGETISKTVRLKELSNEENFVDAIRRKDWNALESLAAKGYDSAYIPLANHFLSIADAGTDVEQNYKKAYEYARKAKDSGHESEAEPILRKTYPIVSK